MNLGEIVTEVRINLKDQRADVLASIQDFVNEARDWVAAEKSLPALKTIFTVDTVVDQAYTNMSATFDGRLLYCGTSDGKIDILSGGLEELLNTYPDITEEGDVEAVAIEGNVLWYAKIPETATTLTCLGYSKPTTLTLTTDTPAEIPEYLRREILVNKATEIGYSIIEEGLEGPRPNTEFYAAKVELGLQKLDRWISMRRGHKTSSIWSD